MSIRSLFLLFFWWIPITLLSQNAQLNLSLLGNLDYENILVLDVWGYVAPDSTEYALVGLESGLSIVSLADPSNPVEIHRMAGPISGWRDIKTFKNFAYVVNETGGGLAILNLENLPAEPLMNRIIVGNSPTTHNIFIDENGFLYMAGVGNSDANGGIIIADLNGSPMSPEVVGVYADTYVHDVYVRNNRGYAAEMNRGRLRIIDFTSKSDPSPLGEIQTPFAFTHNTWLSDNGKVCYITDEIPGSPIVAYDVTNPLAIKKLGEIRSSLSGGLATPHNVFVLNDFLVSSYYTDGVHLTDARDPNNLREYGYFDTSNWPNPEAYEGNWGVYPFLPSGNILATDIQEGLFVLKPSFPPVAILNGKIKDELTGEPLEGVVVKLFKTAGGQESLEAERITNENGTFTYKRDKIGVLRVELSKFGFKSQSKDVGFVPGETGRLDINLQAAEILDFGIQTLDGNDLVAIGNVDIAVLGAGEIEPFVFEADSTGNLQIPAFPEGQYEISAVKWGYQLTCEDFLLGPEEPVISILLNEGYQDNFSFDLGWSVSGNAEVGHWERGVPVATFRNIAPANPGSGYENDKGRDAYVTGLTGQLYYDNVVDKGNTILRSPQMRLRNYGEPELSFAWWLANFDERSSSAIGKGFLSVRITNGVEEVELANYVRQSIPGSWDTSSFLLRDFISLTDNMQLIIEASNKNFPDILEAGFDAFLVQDLKPTNSQLNIQDIGFEVYPNPASGNLYLRTHSAIRPLQAELYDLNGRQLKSIVVKPGQVNTMQLGHLPASIYMVKLRDEGQVLAWKKVVIHNLD